MKTYKVSLIFIYDDKENPEIKNTEDAVDLAAQELDDMPISDLYFEVEVTEQGYPHFQFNKKVNK